MSGEDHPVLSKAYLSALLTEAERIHRQMTTHQQLSIESGPDYKLKRFVADTVLALRLLARDAPVRLPLPGSKDATSDEPLSKEGQAWLRGAVDAATSVSMTVRSASLAVRDWMSRMFGVSEPWRLTRRSERATRLLEEAIELAQSEGVPQPLARSWVDRVYARPVGEPSQEAAGLLICLLAWDHAAGGVVESSFKTELDRINHPDMMERIRAKQAEKDAVGGGYPGTLPDHMG